MNSLRFYQGSGRFQPAGSCDRIRDWETFGLPGMKVTWEYALEKAGQLGHVAYRHRKLECTFERSSDRQRFAEIWRRHTRKTPVFESSESNA